MQMYGGISCYGAVAGSKNAMDESNLTEDRFDKEDAKPRWQGIKSKWQPIIRVQYPFLFASVLAVIVLTVITVWGIRKAVYSDRLANFMANAAKMTDVMEFGVLQNRYAAVPETLGIANVNLKQTIMGKRPPNNPDLVKLLSAIKAVNRASIVYAMNEAGTVVGSTTYADGKSLLGNSYAFRPYFKEAMKGTSFLYAALGITTKKRGLYYSSPVYRSLEKSEQPGDIIGVMVLKLGLSEVDAWLNGLKGPAALVTSRGVVFAGNRKKWMFHATKTNTIVDSMQFSDEDRADLKYLDVNINGQFANLDNKTFAVAGNTLNLKDEYGKWEFIWLQDTSTWFSLWNMALCSAIVGLFYLLLALFFLHQTVRKRAEKGLRESEENYRSIFDSANDALFIQHIETGEIISVNRKMCEMYGYSKEEAAEISVNDISEGIPPYSHSDALEWVRKAVGGAPQLFDWKARHRSGRIFWVEVNLKRAVIGGEKRLLAIVREITSRKQAEQTLAKSLESLKLSESVAGLGYFERNWQNGEGFWSEGFYQLMGETPDDLDCTHAEFMKYVHPDDVKRVGAHIRETLETRTYMDIEFRLVQAGGAIIDIHGKGRNSYDESGKPLSTIGTFLDITKHKKAALALRESEDKYRTILESLEDGYYEVDIDGNFTFFNDSLCEIYGYPKNEMMGRNIRKLTDQETAKRGYSLFNKVYTTGRSEKGFEWSITRKDGTNRVVEATVSLKRNAEGVPRGFRGIVRDISGKHRLEAQLQHAKRMESIGTLAGGIAHNFNNLLMGIQGNASMALLDIDSSNPRRKNLKNIERLVENGAKLTAQLIGYAREGSYEVKPISLNQLVKETSDTFGMTKKEISVHQALSEKLYGINADQGQIEQVLLNLYVNAADAMPEGGDLFLKTMNVTDKDITGKPYKVQSGNYVLLTVRDTGIGMDKETRERIFEPFFTTKGLASGTGLGMASAYGIIKGHGGYIDVDSEVGEGTHFSIYLPATEKVIEEKKVLSDELVKGKGTVLLVDDEEMVLEAGKELLNHLGYEVLLAENGREALELYKKNQDKIDLILLDMVMPVMGGGEAFDRMKEINTNVKVLLSSGYSLEGEAKEILKRGCDAFIQKPFKIEQLSQKLRGILDKK